MQDVNPDPARSSRSPGRTSVSSARWPTLLRDRARRDRREVGPTALTDEAANAEYLAV
ncbi:MULTISPECIES: hypothetical protein [Haloarcula]|uniref:hypothetical protein n=1 Tax=Haloarcula TaxID=2237 RepID=UPI0023EC82A9|nr:hypothetical protein [Halomicroarcula sp. XH51]